MLFLLSFNIEHFGKGRFSQGFRNAVVIFFLAGNICHCFNTFFAEENRIRVGACPPLPWGGIADHAENSKNFKLCRFVKHIGQ